MSGVPGTLVVLQPGYLPWLGFFDQMRRADVFVYYDDVQYDKHGWRNRNRIKGPDGQPWWLTVPVRHRGRHPQRILEAEIDVGTAWARKHLGTIHQCYARAPHLDRYLPELAELLQRPWKLLVDLDLAVLELIRRWLGLTTKTVRASELAIGGSRAERLVRLCRHFGADTYLTGDAAETYLDAADFAACGIRPVWQRYRHPIYPQLHGSFLPHLSIVDLLFNCGEASSTILAGQGAELPP